MFALFYFLSCVTIGSVWFYDNSILGFLIPILVSLVGIIYVRRIEKINWWYLCSLVFLMVSFFLNYYYGFKELLSVINLTMGSFYLISAYIVYTFLNKEKVKKDKIFTLPVYITLGLIFYLIYAFIDLLYEQIRHGLVCIAFCITSLFLYVTSSYLVYSTQVYKGSIRLILIVSTWMFLNSMIPINELLFYHKIFASLIVINIIVGIVFFLIFLLQTKPENNPNETEHFL